MDKDIVPEVKELNRNLGPGFVTHTLPYDEEVAVLQFESRYGFPPEKVEEFKGFLMVGPIPERELLLANEADNRNWSDDPKHWGGMNDD